jgi:hypothetical protein
VGTLALSVPLFAQGGRFEPDRSRGEQRRDDRSGDRRGDRTIEARTGKRTDPRATPRAESRVVPRAESRVIPRANPRTEQRSRPVEPWSRGEDRRDERRVDRPDRREDRNRFESRGSVRTYDTRTYDTRTYDSRRYDPRGYGRRTSEYRVYDFDRGRREAVFIGGWFRGHWELGRAYRERGYGLERQVFDRGIYLSAIVLGRLELLPFDLELELGELPPYLERRMYGRTVLVIDMRTRMVIDVYDVDW